MISYALIAVLLVPHDKPVRMILDQGLPKETCERERRNYQHQREYLRRKLGENVQIICEIDEVGE